MEQDHGNDNSNNDNSNNNNTIINSPSPPPPSTLTITTQTSNVPSIATIATSSSQTNHPIPYYVDIPPSQNTLQPIAPVGFPPPHNYWHNPPHLIPRRMYTTYNMDPGGPESRVFSDSFGKGKPLQYEHATHELMRHGLPDFVYNIPKLKPLGRSRAVPFLKEPVKQILLNPPVFRELEELDDEALLNITGETLFARQRFHTQTVEAKLKYINALQTAWQSIPALTVALSSKPNPLPSRNPRDQPIRSISSSEDIIVPTLPPQPVTTTRQTKLSKKEQQELERRQIKYFETLTLHKAEQAQLSATISILLEQLEAAGLPSYLRNGGIYNNQELNLVQQTRTKIEHLRTLRADRIRAERTARKAERERTTEQEDGGVQITPTLSDTPPTEEAPKATIGTLPTEILSLVLNHLAIGPKADLLSAALISRKWHELTVPLIYRNISFGEDIEEEVEAVLRTRAEKSKMMAEDEARRERIKQRQLRRAAKGKMRMQGVVGGGLVTPGGTPRRTPGGTPVGVGSPALGTPRLESPVVGSPAVGGPGEAGGYFDLPVGNGGDGVGLTPVLLSTGALSPCVEYVNPGTPLPKGEIDVEAQAESLDNLVPLSVEDELDGVKVKRAKKLSLKPSYRSEIRKAGEACVTMNYTIRVLSSLKNSALAKHVRSLQYYGLSFQAHPSLDFLVSYPKTFSYGVDMNELRRRSVARIRELIRKVVRNLTKVESLVIQGRDVVVVDALMGLLKWSGPHLRELKLQKVCLSKINFDRGSKRDGNRRLERLEELEFTGCWVHTSNAERGLRQRRRNEPPPPPPGAKLSRWLRIARRLWRFLDDVSDELVSLTFNNCGFPVEPILGGMLLPGGEPSKDKLLFPSETAQLRDLKGRRLYFRKLEALRLELVKRNRQTWYLVGRSDPFNEEALSNPHMEGFIKAHEGVLKELVYHGQLLANLKNINDPLWLRVQTSLGSSLTTLTISHNSSRKYVLPGAVQGNLGPYTLHGGSATFKLARLLDLLRSLNHLKNFAFHIGTGCTFKQVLSIAKVLMGRDIETFAVGPVRLVRRPVEVLTVEDVEQLVVCLGAHVRRLEIIPATRDDNIHLGMIEDEADEDDNENAINNFGFAAQVYTGGFGMFMNQGSPVQAVEPASPPQVPPGIFLGQMANNYGVAGYGPGIFLSAPGLGSNNDILLYRQPMEGQIVKSGDIGFDFDRLLRILAPLRNLESLTLPYFYPPPLPVAALDLLTLDLRLKIMHPIDEKTLSIFHRRRVPFRPNPTGNAGIVHPPTPMPMSNPFSQPFNQQHESAHGMAESSSVMENPDSLGPAQQPEKCPIVQEAHEVKLAFLSSARRIGRGFCTSTASFPSLVLSSVEEPIWPRLKRVSFYIFSLSNISTVEIEEGAKGWSVEREVGGMGGIKSWAWEWERELRRSGEVGRGLVVGESL